MISPVTDDKDQQFRAALDEITKLETEEKNAHSLAPFTIAVEAAKARVQIEIARELTADMRAYTAQLKKAIDDHTDKMGVLAKELNRWTGLLFFATLGLVVATVGLVVVELIAKRDEKQPQQIVVPAPVVNVQPAVMMPSAMVPPTPRPHKTSTKR
jgi:hypothetical protein